LNAVEVTDLFSVAASRLGHDGYRFPRLAEPRLGLSSNGRFAAF